MSTDRLSNRENVLFVERALERRSAMTRCSERDPLRRRGGIGVERVVVGDEPGNVCEYRFGRRLACQRTDFHLDLSFCPPPPPQRNPLDKANAPHHLPNREVAFDGGEIE